MLLVPTDRDKLVGCVEGLVTTDTLAPCVPAGLGALQRLMVLPEAVVSVPPLLLMLPLGQRDTQLVALDGTVMVPVLVMLPVTAIELATLRVEPLLTFTCPLMIVGPAKVKLGPVARLKLPAMVVDPWKLKVPEFMEAPPLSVIEPAPDQEPEPEGLKLPERVNEPVLDTVPPDILNELDEKVPALLKVLPLETVRALLTTPPVLLVKVRPLAMV